LTSLPDGIDQLDLRTYDLGSATALGVDHHHCGQTSHFVHLLGDGQAFFDILEAGLDRRIR
jgi:hypothetical protein